MKSTKTQFRQDLADPSAGLSSDLYSTVSPIISPEDGSKLDPELHEQLRKGLVGLEYLSGLKSNTGETFYDEHPMQATLMDVLKNSGTIGAGAAGLGTVTNLLRQHANMKMTEPGSMARGKNPLGDRTHPLEALRSKKDKPVSADLASIFGDMENSPLQRTGLVDRMNQGSTNYTKQYADIQEKRKKVEEALKGTLGDIGLSAGSNVGHNPQIDQGIAARLREQRAAAEATHKSSMTGIDEELKKLLSDIEGDAGHGALGKYVDLHHSLQDAQQKGGLRKYLGEWLNTSGEEGGRLQQFLRKHVAPNQDQAIIDLLEKRNITGAHQHLDKELVKNIIAKNLGIDPNSERMRAIMETGFERLKDVSHQGKPLGQMRHGLGKAWVRHRTPILAGAGIAAGGVGLHKLLQAIQNQAYSDDQIKDWKRTLLQSRGDFEGADKIN